jgi:hypothetical protein
VLQLTCVECSLKVSLRFCPSASDCVSPLMAVQGSLMCIIAKGGSALMIALACRMEKRTEQSRGAATMRNMSQAPQQGAVAMGVLEAPRNAQRHRQGNTNAVLHTISHIYKSTKLDVQFYLSTRLECHVDSVGHNAVLRADRTSSLRGQKK